MSRHVVVTGAASGIGFQTAHRFAALGDSVTVVDFRQEALLAAADLLREACAATVRSQTVDLRDPKVPQSVISAAWEDGPIDVLVNCAGVYPATPYLTLDANTWDRVQNLNVRAPMLTSVALAQKVIATHRGAVIVNISSGAALRARPGAAPYSTSKAALEMLTRASALELGQYGIRVNAVSPGFVTVGSQVNPVTEEYADAVSTNALGRKGQPDDIARAVLWLASEEANWVTGSILRVDGGASTGALNLPLHWAFDNTADER